ncbi:MAG: hypothetical protein KC609_05585 [Myxococcales bacterium]|nr:hypothetical protein [Myxococcales bacterium]
MTREALTSAELLERVLYSLLKPVVKLARVNGISSKALAAWVQLAYFHDLRRSGLTMAEACERLDISMRTASRLSKQLKQDFFRPEREHQLPRQIEFMLWLQPLSEARLEQALPGVERDEIRAALETLIAEKRIVEQRGRTTTYSAASSTDRLVRPGWMARIGGLNSLLSTVLNAIYGRFFGNGAPTFARNLSLRILRDDVSRLNQLYETTIWPELAALDERAEGRDDALPLSFALLWAPYEALENNLNDSADGET